jgi:hypothetical protein
VLDSPVPHFIVVPDLLFRGKLPHEFSPAEQRNVLVGDKVVRHQGDLLRIKHLLLPDLLNMRMARGAVMSFARARSTFTSIRSPGPHEFQPCMGRKNLLRNGHRMHGQAFPIASSILSMKPSSSEQHFWSNGVLERWSTGHAKKKRVALHFSSFSIVPSFHHSRFFFHSAFCYCILSSLQSPLLRDSDGFFFKYSSRFRPLM